MTGETGMSTWVSMALLPVAYPPFRLELLDTVTADHRALLAFHTGLPPPPEEACRHKNLCQVDSKWAAAAKSSLAALADLMKLKAVRKRLAKATASSLSPNGSLGSVLAKSQALQQIHKRAGTKGVQAVATRILKPLSAFPSYLTMLATTALRGGRVQLVEGPPGSAKTALVAMAYVFLSTFSDIDIICTSQQNSTSFEIADAVLEIADSDSDAAKEMHVLVSGQALTTPRHSSASSSTLTTPTRSSHWWEDG